MRIIEDLQKQLGESNGSVEEMQCIFYETAKKLMNECILKIGNDLEIELKELEFYYYDDEKHPDKFTHKKPKQLECCKLYVHKKSKNKVGIDITFGNAKYWGGILIRGIKVNKEFIAGPARVSQKITKLLGKISDEKDEFNHEKLQEQFNFLYEKGKISLEKEKSDDYEFLYVYSRAGLNKKFSKFTDTLYRFFSYDYFNKKKMENRSSLSPIDDIKIITHIVHNKKFKEIIEKGAGYNINNDNIEKIENYCKEQNCKYHICYYIESLKQKLKNNHS